MEDAGYRKIDSQAIFVSFSAADGQSQIGVLPVKAERFTEPSEHRRAVLYSTCTVSLYLIEYERNRDRVQ